MNYLLRNALLDLFPDHEGIGSIVDADLDGFLAVYRREADLSLRFGIAAATLLYTMTPIFTVGRPLLAPLLSPELRDLHADRITRSSIYLVRQAMFLLKTLGGLCWGAHPRIRASLGLPAYEHVENNWRKS